MGLGSPARGPGHGGSTSFIYMRWRHRGKREPWRRKTLQKTQRDEDSFGRFCSAFLGSVVCEEFAEVVLGGDIVFGTWTN